MFAAELNLGDEKAAGPLGTMLLALGDDAGAVAVFERALKTIPDNATLHGALGNAYYGLGNAGAAVRCYRRALALDPGL